MSSTTTLAFFQKCTKNLNIIVHHHFRYHLVDDHVVFLQIFSGLPCNSTPLLYDHNFFSCPIFSNPHTLFITFTRSSLDSFRWRDFSVSSRVKLQLRGTTTDCGTASPSLVWFQPSSLIPQTTNRSRIVNFFHIWISLRSTNQKIWSVYVKCKQGHHEEA